jgi:hypothetical protein
MIKAASLNGVIQASIATLECFIPESSIASRKRPRQFMTLEQLR